MESKLCSKCKKNLAVIFITKIENGVTKNEGLCLKCAKGLNIKPINDAIEKMGLSDEELEGLTEEMTNAMGEVGDLFGLSSDDDDDILDEGKTATFPFLNKLFGASGKDDIPEIVGEPSDEPSSTKSNHIPNSGGATPPPNKNVKRKSLDAYSINLTERARQGKLDEMIGRDDELARVIQILNRRQKNNPCLIGEPGVGKTAIAEGLAQRIAYGNVPMKLRNKEVHLLDLTSLVAGTQFRGQFESRMKALIEEVRKAGNIILVIDEVHSIVGAGDAEGSMNAANILKPALSRGEIQVIGATTFTEYRKHIEKDTALERRFQPVTVAEPSIEDSVKIIEGIAHYYEECHQVKIPKDMCRMAVVMSERYITDRFLPDKAIDLIDEACSDVNLRDEKMLRMEEIRRILGDFDRERDLLLSDTKNEHYERLAQIRQKSMGLNDELNVLQANPPQLSQASLARVIELWTKIPASSITEDEFDRLSMLGDRLKAHVVGQDEAIKSVCSAIKRNRVGLQAKRKPVSFIFVGGTGVGKTELVKRLAEDLFDSPDSLIRLDMSEFMEKFSVSRLIGSPPGYVGYDDAGQLTEKIRRKPYSVVLFDEIEKAHPDVLNILLQILDDGRITDAQGRTINFENAVVIMTTNAGSNNQVGSVGFSNSRDERDKEKTMKALREFLRPEFINRVDEIINFNKLSEENFAIIAEIMLNELKTVLNDKKISIVWDETVVEYLVKKAYNVTYGARNLRRTIQKDIEDKIAEAIVDQYRGKLSEIKLSATADEILLEVK